MSNEHRFGSPVHGGRRVTDNYPWPVPKEQPDDGVTQYCELCNDSAATLTKLGIDLEVANERIAELEDEAAASAAKLFQYKLDLVLAQERYKASDARADGYRNELDRLSRYLQALRSPDIFNDLKGKVTDAINDGIEQTDYEVEQMGMCQARDIALTVIEAARLETKEQA